jgi:hypothetical protein
MTATTTHTASPELEHFIKLAQRGRKHAASTYERRSLLVADALLDTIPGLDDQAVAGLIEFAQLIKGNYQTLREMIAKP